MRAGAVLLLLAAVAATAPDAHRVWRKQSQRLDKLEKQFWKDYQRRFSEALITFDQPFNDVYARKSDEKEVVNDFSDIRRLYEEYVGLQKARGKIAAEYATSGHARAGPTLKKELFETIKAAGKAEEELRHARPMRYYTFSQRPGILRHGLAVRQQELMAALAKVPGYAPELMDKGLQEAAKRDLRGATQNSVALIDTLGMSGDPAVKPTLEQALQSKVSSLRIAALEALARFGEEALPSLLPLLEDRSAAVRLATVEALRGIGSAKATPALASRLADARGVLRAELVKTLEQLTAQKFGAAPDAWKEWYEAYQEDIEAGRFDIKEVEVQEAERVDVPDELSFYGVGSPSRNAIFVIDGSWVLSVPASVKKLKERYIRNWRGASPAWKKETPSHKQVLLRELNKTLASMHTDAGFALTLLHADFKIESLGAAKKLLRPTKRDVAKVQKRIKSQRANRGWCSQYQGLREALRLCGLDPEQDGDFGEPDADAIYLWNPGAPGGGRYMLPEPVVDAFARLNRFRRVRVYAIRIGNNKEDGERLMKGLAERSGGSYLWSSEPPE